MRPGAGVMAPLVLLLALMAVVACAAPPPTARPTPSAAPVTPAPTQPPTPAPSSAAAPPGTDLVDVPTAGLRIPVPEGWEQANADALDDPDRRDEIVARYPGVGTLLEAAAEMGDRAVPAFAAFDPAAGPDVPLTPTIAVLVSQPSVGGPLLDLVAGFVGGGLEETFEAVETGRERVTTPLGEAVRLEYAFTLRGGTALTAVEYLIGAPAGTLLVSVMGPANVVAALDPAALVAALAPMP